MLRVLGARKKAGVKYPQLYAEKKLADSNPDAMNFNCVQRAHQQTLESVAQVLIGMMLTGLRYPRLASGLGITWVVGKVLYSIGYGPKGPNRLVSLRFAHRPQR